MVGLGPQDGDVVGVLEDVHTAEGRAHDGREYDRQREPDEKSESGVQKHDVVLPFKGRGEPCCLCKRRQSVGRSPA
jgi:hypothetical protein